MLPMNGGANATFTNLKLQPFSTDPNFKSAGMSNDGNFFSFLSTSFLKFI